MIMNPPPKSVWAQPGYEYTTEHDSELNEHILRKGTKQKLALPQYKRTRVMFVMQFDPNTLLNLRQ